jgi:porin
MIRRPAIMRLKVLASCLAAVAILEAGAARSEDAPPAPSLNFTIAYTAEGWGLAEGGQRPGERYVDNLDLQLTADLEMLVGWSGARVFIYGLYNNGTPFSGDLIGDLQGVSSIETGIEAFRLEEAWLDQTFAEGHGSLRVGLYNLNSEFDASLVRSVFINPSHGIGPDFSQAGLNGPSIFPVTSLAARLGWSFDGGAYVRAAVLDGVPGDPDHPKRTTIDLSAHDGALLVAEAGQSYDDGTLLSIGIWDFTAAFDDLVEPSRRHGDMGAYAAAEGPLLPRTDQDPFELSAFARLGFANDDINPISSYFGAGLVAAAPFAARPNDKLGLAVAIASVGEKYRAIVEAGGGDPASREMNVELTYQAPVIDGIVVQPDVQWIVDPGADGRNANVVAVGLRVRVDHSWSD